MGQSKSALIVEDHPLNAEILATLLTVHGVEPYVIESPAQLSDTLEQNRRKFDLIFLDIEFQGYDGFEVHQDLKADPLFHGVPVIAYTVHTSELERARHEGFDSFLSKPLNQDKFGGQLATILKGGQVWDG